MKIDENLHWILSFYRTSEISGALFFGQLAKSLKPSPIQMDMTRHFADEAQHAGYWTDCMARLGCEPLKLDASYQDQYISTAGMPVNLMEILAITQVFERRVINQYALHTRMADIDDEVKSTLVKIMDDEKWHIHWIRQALKSLEPEYGAEHIAETLRRFTQADREVYARVAAEHESRLNHLPVNRR